MKDALLWLLFWIQPLKHWHPLTACIHAVRGGPWLLLLVVFFMVEAALLQAEPASYDLANCNFKSWVVECKIV